MRRLRKFWNLPPGQRWLWLRAAGMMGLASLAVRILPFSQVRRLLVPSSDHRPEPHEQPRRFSLEEISAAVTVASRYVPGASCLPQAVVAEALLKREGHPASIHVGVAKDQNRLQAHAWVESSGTVFVGGPDSPAVYNRLPALDGKGR